MNKDSLTKCGQNVPKNKIKQKRSLPLLILLMVVVVKNFSVARELKVASNSKTQEVAMEDHLELNQVLVKKQGHMQIF